MGSIRRAVMGAGLLSATVLSSAAEPTAAMPVKLDIKSQPTPRAVLLKVRPDFIATPYFESLRDLSLRLVAGMMPDALTDAQLLEIDQALAKLPRTTTR